MNINFDSYCSWKINSVDGKNNSAVKYIIWGVWKKKAITNIFPLAIHFLRVLQFKTSLELVCHNIEDVKPKYWFTYEARGEVWNMKPHLYSFSNILVMFRWNLVLSFNFIECIFHLICRIWFWINRSGLPHSTLFVCRSTLNYVCDGVQRQMSMVTPIQ